MPFLFVFSEERVEEASQLPYRLERQASTRHCSKAEGGDILCLWRPARSPFYHLKKSVPLSKRAKRKGLMLSENELE